MDNSGIQGSNTNNMNNSNMAGDLPGLNEIGVPSAVPPMGAAGDGAQANGGGAASAESAKPAEPAKGNAAAMSAPVREAAPEVASAPVVAREAAPAPVNGVTIEALLE